MKNFRKALSLLLASLIVMSCWVWVDPAPLMAEAANAAVKDKYLFAYFTGTSKEGQTIHLAVSEDGYNYTALRGNDPVIIPSKGVGNVRDPYIWYNEQDNYYYILATDLDFTDEGGTYSNHSTGFIVWRSEDLVTWHDETFIDVSRMAHLIGDTRNMSAVWAPQVLWDGSSYVVYFTLACNATSWFDIVYLKTTDIMDPAAYYEFDYILGNSTGNGVDNGYGNIDADIIYNPGDGKYYLFYKTECNSHELGSTSSGSSLKTIHYYVGDSATGPFTNPGDNKWSNCGFSVFPNYNVSLEGCNSFWDNDGNLVMYVDEFEHTNVAGEAKAYFHIAKSNGTNFKSWTYPDVSQHNINSLSPRHGSVVKITTEEYNRLLDNSYRVSSSSFGMDEELEDHLVGRFFTTDDVLHNAVVGKPDLDMSSNVTMSQLGGSWVANFNTGYATIDLEKLLPNSLNYDDGFTITFKANLPTTAPVNARIYEIADIPGKRTGVEHYTHFAPVAEGNGSYMGSYNGPDVAATNVDSNDWASDMYGLNRNDGYWHEYLISYANGNYMVYIDGILCITRNRHTTAVTLDDTWYKAIGQSTMYIGRSGFRNEYGSQYNDPDLTGQLRDLCIYDTSMSYYDLQDMDAFMKSTNNYTDGVKYDGVTSKIPVFPRNTGGVSAGYYSNLLKTTPITDGMTEGSGENTNPTKASSAAVSWQQGDLHFGLFYAKSTVMILDGKSDPKMPVMVAGRINANNYTGYLNQVWPSSNTSDYPDSNTDLYMQSEWRGYSDQADFNLNAGGDSYLGHNASTSREVPLDNTSGITGSQSKRDVRYWAGVLTVDTNVDYSSCGYYKKYNLVWTVKGKANGSTFSTTKNCPNNDIYVIDFRPIVNLRSSITEDEFERVMDNKNYCQALKEKYADAVFAIKTLNPNSYNYEVAPEVATKACAKAIKDAVDNYNGVMEVIRAQEASGHYGHETVVLEARQATCSMGGLTEGEYCTLCSEVLKEQETIPTTPHTFGAVFTENGVKYVQCSVCGVKLEYKVYEARYENLFSFNGWAGSSSAQVFNGTISTDVMNGTITITNNNNSEIYTRGHYDGQNLVSTRDFANYCIPVVGGRTYVVEATSKASSTSGGEVFIFQYNKDGLVFSAIPTVLGLGAGQTNGNFFTVDQKAAYIELRFDCNDAGKTITYENIGVYEVDSYGKFAQSTTEARVGFYPGDSKDLVYPNTGAGYAFNGWQLKDGNSIFNTNILNIHTNIIYGNWVEAGFDITYDSIFSFSNWAKSSCNQLWYGDAKDANGNTIRLVDSDGLDVDYAKGTIGITNDADTTNFARTNYWAYNANVYKMTLEQNTEYILEYTVESDDGAKPSVCLYLTGGTAQYPETGSATRYSTGTHYYRFSSGDNTTLTLRFDNVQHDSTAVFSGIAVYKADFEEAARTITNRQYRRYYRNGEKFGSVFDYTPVRPGFTFKTWWADLAGNIDGSWDFDCANLDATAVVDSNYYVFSEWNENNYNIAYNANGGSGSIASQNTKYTAAVALASSGFTKGGYILSGWSTSPSATTATYQLGQSVSRLNGTANGTTTLYAVWVEAGPVNVTFDNMVDISAWSESAGNGTIVAETRTDTGFTVKSDDGVSESTCSSSHFAIEAGHTYVVEADIKGGPWDVYVFFCNDAGTWVDFADGPSNRFSSNGTGNNFKVDGIKYSAEFTAPAGSTKVQLRVDANGSNNAVRFENIRVYDVTETTYLDIVNKVVEPGAAYGELPVPVKPGYIFNGWKDQQGNIVTADTIVTSNSTVYLTSTWSKDNSSISNDSVVIEYGLPVRIDVLANDNTKGTVTAIGDVQLDSSVLGSTAFTSSKFATKSLDLANGAAQLNADGSITYTPDTTNAQAEDVFYYEVQANGSYYYAKVTVIPATTIYYEDTFFTFNDKDNYKWQTVGTNTLTQVFQSVDRPGAYNFADDVNAAYGFDVAYDGEVAYSGGSARFVEVDKAAGANGPTAVFTFTGTGFDLFTAQDCLSGTITATVYRGTEVGKNRVQGIMSNAYFGYDYQNGEFVPVTGNGAIYQVPIIRLRDLSYDTYTVVVMPRYNQAFDVLGTKKCGTYVDSVRIYDPMGDSNTVANDAYKVDGEFEPKFLEIRDTLVKANGDGSYDVSALGQGKSVFLDGGKTSMSDFAQLGPKNEVYLEKNQSISFDIVTDRPGLPSTIQLGMRLTGKGGSSAVVKLLNTNYSSWSQNITLNSAAERYYNIEAVVDWVEQSNGTYKTASPVIVTNTSDAVISLTSLKWAFASDDNTAVMLDLFSDSDTPVLAMAALNRLANPDAQEGSQPSFLKKENIGIAFEGAPYVAGDTGILTITTEKGVAGVTVNGNDVTACKETADGKLIWTYDFAMNEPGKVTLEVLARDDNGFTSEAIYATAEFSEAAAEDNTQSDSTSQGGTNVGSTSVSILSRIFTLLAKLIGFLLGGVSV